MMINSTASRYLDWTEILKRGGVPDSPGFQECLQDCREHPYVKPQKRPSKKKGR